eukprot:TRINITY_DN1574_c0_g1_i1.p1 TRINITY_DN1574_c0_g1~~TRINITY_DN1574_c0_g1_i1.p1  ORF type:complete len:230 (-),score=73.87 TRINITY_DN1574_c0_g1_i1:52-741(-)
MNKTLVAIVEKKEAFNVPQSKYQTATMSDTIFASTKRFAEAVALINGIESKFGLFLAKILEGLDQTKERTFSDEEEEQLVALLGLDGVTELQTVVDACSFIFQQSAFQGFKPAKLGTQLGSTGLDDDKIETFVTLWESDGANFVDKLRGKSLGGMPVLDSVKWRMHLEMSQSSLTRVNEPTALFEFKTKQETVMGDEEQQAFIAEFDHDALLAFYNQLERLQGQLDNMS